MKKIDLLNMLTNIAKEYRIDCAKSIIRNRHMTDLSVNFDGLEQKVIDAILVDFINCVGVFQEVDYGLHHYHIKEDKKFIQFLKDTSKEVNLEENANNLGKELNTREHWRTKRELAVCQSTGIYAHNSKDRGLLCFYLRPNLCKYSVFQKKEWYCSKACKNAQTGNSFASWGEKND